MAAVICAICSDANDGTAAAAATDGDDGDDGDDDDDIGACVATKEVDKVVVEYAFNTRLVIAPINSHLAAS